MKRIFQLVQITFAALILCACATRPQEITLDSAKSISQDQVATLRMASYQADYFFSGELAYIANIYDKDGHAVRTGMLRHKVRLAPGRYRVQILVMAGPWTYPEVELDARPGMTYIFSVAEIMDKRAIRASYKEVPSTSPEAINYAEK